MKKTVLSEEQLDQVVRLRQSSSSFLNIEKTTGIPRRTAKREFENWERNQSLTELREARREVAAGEFRDHLNLLVNLAGLIVGALQPPNPPDDLRDADEILYRVYRESISPASQPSPASHHGDDRDGQRLLRMGLLLFKALRDHTRDALPWQALESWKQARNSCVRKFERLRGHAPGVIRNVLAQEKYRGLAESVERGSATGDAVKALADGVAETIYRSMLTNTQPKVVVFKGTSLLSEGVVELRWGGDTSSKLAVSPLDVALKAKDVCNYAITNLVEGKQLELCRQIRTSIWDMSEAAEPLELVLNPLVLRPAILRTRCDICPV